MSSFQTTGFDVRDIRRVAVLPSMRNLLVLGGFITLLCLVDYTSARAHAAEESHQWQPFRRVVRPAVPHSRDANWPLNPIDSFVAAEREQRDLLPRPDAPKAILLRRVYLDLIGLLPTPAEQDAFLRDSEPRAYERVVDRLLNDPRYGERWGRHWMDIWRYSDWAGWSGGNQIRDSKPHVWRWRDWIIRSLNEDKGYDQMILEMLAADELAPANTNALAATGYLVRNYKLLSREQWLEDTVKHTSQAFLGVTMGCAKCHDHLSDPIAQTEYYQMRAIFEPHQVRTDRVPGELDTGKAGLVRVYDSTNTPTYFFIRGDERKPDTNRVMAPGIPKALAVQENPFEVLPVSLPAEAAYPDNRPFVIEGLIAASQTAINEARAALEKTIAERASSDAIDEHKLRLELAQAKNAALLAVLKADELKTGSHSTQESAVNELWSDAAKEASALQRREALMEAKLKVHLAKVAESQARAHLEKEPDKLKAAEKALTEATEVLAKAETQSQLPPTTEYVSRKMEVYPESSTGRRLAFARWVANANNPLTARVAMNHIWLRHFGRGIVNTPSDFGRNGERPSHPELLDWLAAEFMEQGWSMKRMHRLIVTSRSYRMASTPDSRQAAIDPDNIYLWRMPSRRMEAEVVRDNLLYAAGQLDPEMGGPEIDHTKGLVSKRRSVYLQLAAEKEVEFLKVFDGPNVTECYQRHSSVMPQQALALANNKLSLNQAQELARVLRKESAGADDFFVTQAFRRILSRGPTVEELGLCVEFIQRGAASNRAQAGETTAELATERARRNLILVLFNHNDFVTIR